MEGGGEGAKTSENRKRRSVQGAEREGGGCRIPKVCVISCNRKSATRREPDTTQLLITTSNFIGSWYHAALLFSVPGSIVLLFVLLFSQPIKRSSCKSCWSRQRERQTRDPRVRVAGNLRPSASPPPPRTQSVTFWILRREYWVPLPCFCTGNFFNRLSLTTQYHIQLPGSD